eukprot:4167879-Lingulodinium_polyedra.AAC.1
MRPDGADERAGDRRRRATRGRPRPTLRARTECAKLPQQRGTNTRSVRSPLRRARKTDRPHGD